MEKNQVFVLIGVIAAVAVMMAGAAFIAGRMDNRNDSMNTTKRFTAKPGTERKKAVALSSNKRPSQKAEEASKKTREKPIPVKSLSRPEEGALTAEEETLRSALNSLDPDKGIARLDEALESAHSPEESARLHAARAQLALQKRPPDYERASADFEKAVMLAPTLAARYDILADEAAMLIRTGAQARARAKLEAALAEYEALTLSRVRMRVMLAQVHESSGELKEAEEQYRQSLREALELAKDADPESIDLLRLAGLRLTRLYRKSDRDADAQDLARLLADRFRDGTE